METIRFKNVPARPENIGDIYAVWGYPYDGRVSYGAAYPDTSSNGYAWLLQMGDGDSYVWRDGSEGPDMPYSSMALVRRNPLPTGELSR